MASGRTRIQFPLGGLDRRRGYQDQPPYTTPDCLNVWPKDPIRFRERGGSRPGTLRSPPSPVDDDNIVTFLNGVDISDEKNIRYIFDTFPGTSMSSSYWTALSGESLPDVSSGQASATYSGGSVTRSAMYALPSDIDTTYPASDFVKQEVGIFITPYLGRHWGKYRLYMSSDSTSPDPTDAGVVAELDLTGTGTASGTLKFYRGGAEDSSTNFSNLTFASNGNAGWFSMVAYHDAKNGGGVGVDAIEVIWNGRSLASYDAVKTLGTSPPNYFTGTLNRFGFGLVAEDVDGSTNGKVTIDAFRALYVSDEDSSETLTQLVFSGKSNQGAYGSLWVADSIASATEMNDIGATTIDGQQEVLSYDKPLETAEYFQNLYIADYGEVIASGTDGEIATATSGGGKKVLLSSTYSNWLTSVSALQFVNNYFVRVEGQGDFSITGTESGGGTNDELLLNETWATTDDTGLTFRIMRAPKFYLSNNGNNGSLRPYRASANKGVLPGNCRLICSFSDRVFLAGDPENPNIWNASRQGDATDWDFAAADEDGTKAIASTSAGAFSTIGEPITALIPANEDYLIFGCTKSIFQLRGDPGFGGSITNISREVGVLGPQAWCRTPEGVIVFLSQDGIYQMAPNSVPISISRERFPQELIDINPDQFYLQLAYDIRNRGVWIFVTNKDAVQSTHYFMDWETKTFWPIRFASTDLDPVCNHYYKSKNYEDQRLYIGCRDGNIRYFHLFAPDDDGTGFIDGDSYIDIGPISLGGMEQEGVLRELSAALDTDSGTVDWSVKTADTPEEAIDATAVETGAWTAGQNTVEHPRQRGEAMVLRIAGGEERPWALERINTVIDPAGRQRL